MSDAEKKKQPHPTGIRIAPVNRPMHDELCRATGLGSSAFASRAYNRLLALMQNPEFASVWRGVDLAIEQIAKDMKEEAEQ